MGEDPISSVARFMDDPQWAAFIPEIKSSGIRCRLPSHEDCSLLDVENVAVHLRPGGILGREKTYEERPGQIDMARAVTCAFNAREHLMIEAGTGVGKSLAYLIPAVQWAALNDTPVVISTATRNLQSQLIGLDIPRAVSTLGEASSKFRVALIKGRTNYLCLCALEDFMANGYFALSENERKEFGRLHKWLHETETGDLDEFDGPLRPYLCCSSDECGGRGCKYYSRCFVVKARECASRAHLIVANHSLVLSESVSQGAPILPAYGRIVFDEAHNLEDVATSFFSSEFSFRNLEYLLGRIERKGRNNRHGAVTKGILGAVGKQLAKGALSNGVMAGDIRETVTKIRVQRVKVSEEGIGVFAVLRNIFAPAPNASVLRYRREDGGALQYSLNRVFTDYKPSQWNDDAFAAAMGRFESAIGALVDLLVDLAGLLREEQGDEELPLFGDLVQQAMTLAEMFREFLVDAKFVVGGSDGEHAYWAAWENVETLRANGVRQQVRLTAAPLSVASKLERHFYSLKDSVVLCSATLRVGDRFNYMAQRLGTAGSEAKRVKALVASSPFDYFRQSYVYAADYLPDPAVKSREYMDALAGLVTASALVAQGRTLVLFTSYEMMNAVAERSARALEKGGVSLLVQGRGCSREAMVAALKAGERPHVLFGAQSFWEGVDVPGSALSQVIIARIPFPQVGEPIVEARAEKIDETGGSSFRDYMIPEAVIKFRQGFGRLVRSKTDCGVVIIADPRIATKNYGAHFKKVVPTSVHVVSSQEQLMGAIKDIFSNVLSINIQK